MPGEDRRPHEGLSLHAVHAGYGRRDVLRGVSLTVRPGVVAGLVGPNGSGKTTVVRVASRALRPSAGTVWVGGLDPYAVPSRQAARGVAVVPQALVPAFPFSVLETVLLGRAPYQGPFGSRSGEDWSKTRWAMAAVNVEHLSDRPVEELSGGERQRVVLAQALAQDATVLLLDEPTTHLDLRHVGDLLALVRSLARRDGRAVLAVFHDLNLAAAACDVLFVLSKGRVVASGTPGDVLTTALIAEVFGAEVDVWISPTTRRPSIGFTSTLDGRSERSGRQLAPGVGTAASS